MKDTTCSRCGHKLTDAEPGHLLYQFTDIRLCDLCWDKSIDDVPVNEEKVDVAGHEYPRP